LIPEDEVYVPVTTLFFDLDGTVSNNFQGISRCLNFALARMGLRQLTDDEVLPFVGPPFRESLPRVFPGINIELALNLYRERYETAGWLENTVYGGMAAAIRSLHLQGFTVALCTSKPRIFAERIIDHFDLARYFDGIHGPELDGTFDRKTELLEHLMGRYNCLPARTVMIGDRDKDVEAALHVRAHSLGVLWGFGSREELAGAGAHHIVQHPDELVHTIHAIA
jgi:phosphoglycolate phosphatase